VKSESTDNISTTAKYSRLTPFNNNYLFNVKNITLKHQSKTLRT